MIKNPNHPKVGSSIKAEPIRCRNAIRSIKQLLKNEPRNHCLFVLGINTNLKAKELLQLKAGMVRNLKPGNVVELPVKGVIQSKKIVLNKPCIEAVKTLVNTKQLKDEEHLFCGPKGALRLPSLNRLIKQWCQAVELKGNYGSHTLRKTFGYQQGTQYGVTLQVLMKAFNHNNQNQTLRYLGIGRSQIRSIYENEI